MRSGNPNKTGRGKIQPKPSTYTIQLGSDSSFDDLMKKSGLKETALASVWGVECQVLRMLIEQLHSFQAAQHG